MGGNPQMAVLRRFRKVNVLRLLEMQSNLAQLEEAYETNCLADASADCPTSRSYMKNWEALDESKGYGKDFQREAWRKLRDGLGDYSKHIHCYSRHEELSTNVAERPSFVATNRD